MPNGSLEFLKALAGGHQEVNTFKGQGQRGQAWSSQWKVATWFSAQVFPESNLLNKTFPDWQQWSRSGSLK